MLKQLLAEIASGRNHRLSELAARLETSEGMIAQMMIDLERKGYIACETNLPGACPACHGGCAACALHDPAAAGQTWALTDKGRRRLDPQAAPATSNLA